MEPFMAVWAGATQVFSVKHTVANVSLSPLYLSSIPGFSLDGTSLPGDDLAPYIQQAKDQVNRH